jgi:hypothetical protein
LDLGRDLAERPVPDVSNHGHQESSFGVGRDADVHPPVQPDLALLGQIRRVEASMVLAHVGQGPDDDRERRQAGLPAERLERRGVERPKRGDLWHLPNDPSEVLGDRSPDHRDGSDFGISGHHHRPQGPGSSTLLRLDGRSHPLARRCLPFLGECADLPRHRRARPSGPLHVLVGDPPTRTGSGDPTQLHPKLLGPPANGRGGRHRGRARVLLHRTRVLLDVESDQRRSHVDRLSHVPVQPGDRPGEG